jgi:hypothetical protein
MRWIWKLGLLGAVVVGALGGAGGARGNIVVQFVPVQPNPAVTTGVNILAANGWQCWLLVATADAASGTVAGWDLATPVSMSGRTTSNHTGHDWGIFAISGFIAQRWVQDPDTGVPTPTNYGTPPALSGTPDNGFSGTLATSPDSFFFSAAAFAQATAPSEDNNLLNGSNPPYNRNPVPDNLGGELDTGVGTYMKAAGSAQPSTSQVKSQVIAQVWGVGSELAAFGVVVDGSAKANLYNFTAFAGGLDFPAEPGTVGMLGVGVVMLMRGRRR